MLFLSKKLFFPCLKKGEISDRTYKVELWQGLFSNLLGGVAKKNGFNALI